MILRWFPFSVSPFLFFQFSSVTMIADCFQFTKSFHQSRVNIFSYFYPWITWFPLLNLLLLICLWILVFLCDQTKCFVSFIRFDRSLILDVNIHSQEENSKIVWDVKSKWLSKLQKYSSRFRSIPRFPLLTTHVKQIKVFTLY